MRQNAAIFKRDRVFDHILRKIPDLKWLKIYRVDKQAYIHTNRHYSKTIHLAALYHCYYHISPFSSAYCYPALSGHYAIAAVVGPSSVVRPLVISRKLSKTGPWLLRNIIRTVVLLVWKCVHGVAPAYLSDRCVPATAISGRQHLQRSALCWFHAPRLQLDTEVSQSTDQPHGTVCHQHYGHRTCRRAPSSGH